MPAPLIIHNDPSADLLITARTVWGEARSEGLVGMAAVAWVIRNRWQHPERWAETPKEVCLQPLHFSCWNSNDLQRPRLEQIGFGDHHFCQAYWITVGVIMGLDRDDPTLGSDHYLNPHAVEYWPGRPGRDWWAGIENDPRVTIGRHLFWKLG